jgi:exo-1,4-beta-D-glucosaminidase
MLKRILPVLSILAVACGPAETAGPLSRWTLQQVGSDARYKVTVPCTVAGALNQAGVLGQDILEEGRYRELDRTPFDSAWVFTTHFKADKGRRHVLRFEGLNFYADIELNGVRIASADTTFGPFIVREFDVTALARRKNTLQVTLRRARGGDLNHGFVDWNPRPLDESMGILRPVTLISTPDVQVQDLFVKPLVDPADLSQAKLEIAATLVNRSSAPVEGVLKGVYDSGSFSVPVQLAAGSTRTVTVVEEVDNPRIWWTREMGTPEMYHLDVSFEKNGRVSHGKGVDFGIRSIEGGIDSYGHRQFILNGKKVLIKAGGWTDDIFFQDTPESVKAQLDMVCDMGLNCIRFENIWSKDDYVYDLCDRTGILVLVGWSCQWEWEDYCGLPETPGFGCINDPRSEALAVRYFHDQLIRLRNHPSLIGWLTGSDRIPNPRLEKQYLALYEKLEYRPYICSAKGLSSLAGPSGTKMEGPYEYVGPDYWWVDTRSGGAYGFNTETGPGLNIPQVESLRRMVGEKDLWPIGPNWAYHCTASATHMNSTAFQEKVMEGIYGKADSLEDYMRKAHALDYESERAMFEAFRGNLPRTTGIVQWMLNSAWPSLYWQLYDWYGIPTAGDYGTRNACRPVQLVYNYADGCVWAVNDAVPEAAVEARLRVYDAQGKLVKEERKAFTSCEREPQKVFDKIGGPCFVALELNGDTQAVNFYTIPEKGNVYSWDEASWWGIPFLGYSDLRFVSALPETTLDMQVEKTADGYDVTLTNNSAVIAYQNILKAKNAAGELIPGTFWSDNFFTLCPGDSRTLHCTLPVDHADIVLTGWNAKTE